MQIATLEHIYHATGGELNEIDPVHHELKEALGATFSAFNDLLFSVQRDMIVKCAETEKKYRGARRGREGYLMMPTYYSHHSLRDSYVAQSQELSKTNAKLSNANAMLARSNNLLLTLRSFVSATVPALRKELSFLKSFVQVPFPPSSLPLHPPPCALIANFREKL